MKAENAKNTENA
jgi:hypothetical protein